MSASLVGSEMCIRDRSSGAARTSRELRGQVVGPVLGPRNSSFERLQQSVSYTHLTLPTICSV
eukprot:13333622-Alexandrium_andersonii.AAC.1